MKSALSIVAAASGASLLTYLVTTGQLGPQPTFAQTEDAPAAPSGINYTITEELDPAAWLRGTNNDGSPRPGPADDAKPLVEAENSVCFLTTVEMQAMDGAEDHLACRISVDEFTNWWQVHAVQGEGTDASVTCNARCLVWE